MFDLIIIGAGPGGIALAAEASASGINQSQILVLEKGITHNSAIRQLYPDQKLTTLTTRDSLLGAKDSYASTI
jgi:cation diffusion facilitator CzcD-associated flavoprotein CzcO